MCVRLIEHRKVDRPKSLLSRWDDDIETDLEVRLNRSALEEAGEVDRDFCRGAVVMIVRREVHAEHSSDRFDDVEIGELVRGICIGVAQAIQKTSAFQYVGPAEGVGLEVRMAHSSSRRRTRRSAAFS
jgi:hypothetical protein